MCICMSFRSAVDHGDASGAHNGVTLITEQQEPQQCEEQDTIVPVDLPNEEDSSPSQCLTKGIISLTSSLEVPERALHPEVATGDPVEASSAYNGVALITEGYHSSVKSTIVPVDLPNEDSCPSQCLKKGLSSSTSSLEVSEGARHPAVATGDLGKVLELKRGYNLTDNEKYFCLKNHFVPPNGYTFPSRIMNGQSRSFQASWLERYNGLVYSESEDGGYCKFCVLFAKCDSKVKELGILVSRPFRNFKKSSELLHDHFNDIGKSGGKKCHQYAVQDAMQLLSVVEGYSIDTQLISDQAEKRIRENRLKIRSIAETVIFCGRQGIAMRGHRDDKPAIQENLCANHAW